MAHTLEGPRNCAVETGSTRSTPLPTTPLIYSATISHRDTTRRKPTVGEGSDTVRGIVVAAEAPRTAVMDWSARQDERRGKRRPAAGVA